MDRVIECAKKHVKENYKFMILHFGLLVFVLLIALTLFRYDHFVLQLPGDNLFANITFYVCVITAIISYGIFTLFKVKKWNIEYLYLAIVIPLGIMYCIANPLGKIPDEDQHVRKAYMVSKGVFLSEKDETGKPVGMFNSKIHELVTRSTTSYEDSFSRVAAAETDEEIQLTYSMATYAPICHMPQALGMVIARIFGGGISVQCYAGRVSNMLIAFLLVFFAIKYMPFKKNVVLFIALLPISISEMASLSSDALTLGICIFYIAYILFLKYDENKKVINRKDISILTITSIIVSLSKIVYLPLCLLLFIIPKDKFKSDKSNWLIKISIFALSTFINLGWLVYASTFLNEVNPGVNAGEQVKYILTHPVSYCLILFRTMHIYNQTFLLSLCGEGLGHFNSQASVFFTLTTLVIACMMFFVDDDQERKSFDWITKCICGFIFVCIVLLVYTSLYVAWTSARYPLILGVQSRYFLPALLLTAIVFDNKKIVFNTKISSRVLTTYMMFMNLNALYSLMFMYIYNYIIEYYVK